MNPHHSKWFAGALALAIACAAGSVRADDTTTTTEAREDFLKGAALVKNAQWAEALAQFERSSAKRAHAVTTYNIGACERAMGRYTLARETFFRARQQNEAAQNSELPQGVVTEMNGYIDEIQRLLVDVAVTLDPPEASIAVDGRPLTASTSSTSAFVAGVRAPGPPEKAPSQSFHVLLDPGAHVFTLTRQGYSDGVVNRTFSPGSSVALQLELNKLPATLHIISEPPGAATLVEGVDIGVTPIELSRPGGSYLITVKKSGFLPYESRVTTQPGESANVFAKLPVERPAITQRWWFWTGLGAIVVGGAVSAYLIALSQETPHRPALNGGGLGWTVPVQ